MQNARLDGFRLVLLCCTFFLIVGFLWEPRWPHAMADFKAVYVASHALMQHLDPYKPGDLLQMIPTVTPTVQSGQGSARQLQVVVACINLPTTLFLITPFALLPWAPAHLLWMMLTAGSFILAAFLMWDLGASYAPTASGCTVGFVVANAIILLTGGNTAGVVISLTLIAVWCFLRNRFALPGVLCLALALAIKPQDAGLVWLYFLLAGGLLRKRALQTLLALVMLSLPALIWMSQVAPHWVGELQSNLAVTASRGQLNDPGPSSVTHLSTDMPIHLQTVLSLFSDHPRFYNSVSLLIGGMLLLTWIVITVRSPRNSTNSLLALAIVAPLSMLATYHRLYDARLLLLTLPACALLWAYRGVAGRLALILTSLAIVFTGDFPLIVLGTLTRHAQLTESELSSPIHIALLSRPAPLVLLPLCIFYLWAYAKRIPAEGNLDARQPDETAS